MVQIHNSTVPQARTGLWSGWARHRLRNNPVDRQNEVVRDIWQRREEEDLVQACPPPAEESGGSEDLELTLEPE